MCRDGYPQFFESRICEAKINKILFFFHRQTFGINVLNMEKTEKTMTELEIDYNQRAWEWSRLTESGAALVPMYGPGLTGNNLFLKIFALL